MLQVASGVLKGLQLKSPKTIFTRPTAKQIRQSIFNILRNEKKDLKTWLENSTVVDCFAGTGALGIEAFSNSLATVFFIESNKSALNTLRENLLIVSEAAQNQDLHFQFQVLPFDVEKAYMKLPLVKLFLCDPPYKKNFFKLMMTLESTHHKIEKDGIFIFEADKKDECNLDLAIKARLKLENEKIYGDSKVLLFLKY
jgi:16S rRNA (guanine(966)-N(2))-methyltransferase RsmD